METKEKDKSVWLLCFCFLSAGAVALLLFICLAWELAPSTLFMVTEGAPNLAGAIALAILITVVSVLWIYLSLGTVYMGVIGLLGW